MTYLVLEQFLSCADAYMDFGRPNEISRYHEMEWSTMASPNAYVKRQFEATAFENIRWPVQDTK